MFEEQRYEAAKRLHESLGQKVPFDPKPDNNETWWKRSHCGPGTLDGSKPCECGETQHECAQLNTENIHLFHEQKCACSGFWCPECKLFYPQDACWETYNDEFETIDCKKVKLVDGWIHCDCGEKLFKFNDGEEE